MITLLGTEQGENRGAVSHRLGQINTFSYALDNRLATGGNDGAVMIFDGLQSPKQTFRFPPAMQKEFNGDDRFFPITYNETWKVVREIAESSGTPYNKSAYEAEGKREAEALARQRQQTSPKQ